MKAPARCTASHFLSVFTLPIGHPCLRQGVQTTLSAAVYASLFPERGPADERLLCNQQLPSLRFSPQLVWFSQRSCNSDKLRFVRGQLDLCPWGLLHALAKFVYIRGNDRLVLTFTLQGFGLHNARQSPVSGCSENKGSVFAVPEW